VFDVFYLMRRQVMDKSMQGKMVGAAVVLGLSVGISIEQALAVDEAAGKCGPGCKQPAIAGNPGAMPNDFKVEYTAPSQFTAPGDVAGMKSGVAAEPNNYKLSDVIVSSAKDDTPNTETAKPGGKANAKPRNNARRRAPN
jgi:hypothetical protein